MPDGALFETTDVDFTVAHVDDYELESGPDDAPISPASRPR